MNKSAFILCSLLFAGCAALDIVPENERNFYEIHYASLNKKEIYDRALEWMARNFTDSKSVIQLQDFENKKIIGKGISSYQYNSFVVTNFRYTMIIEIKDGRYKASYNGFTAVSSQYGEAVITDRDRLNKIESRIKDIDDDMYGFILSEKKDW